MNKACPKISVLIPVYNTEVYLKRCIESVIHQTLKDFEVIIVDDGSNDDSAKICDQYAEADARIKVFHRSNHGISATREYALTLAGGTYIQFVDSDDWIEPDMLEKMYMKATSENLDIVGCNFMEHWPHKTISYNLYYEDVDSFVRAIISSHWGVLWNKLFRRTLFINGNVHFPKDINGGEDYVVCVKLMMQTSRVSCVNEKLYHYNRLNENSTINTMNRKKVQEQIDATDIVVRFLEEKNSLDNYSKEILKRKFNSKASLAVGDFKEWVKIYPESNFLVKDMPWGKRKVFLLFKLFIYALSYAKNK